MSQPPNGISIDRFIRFTQLTRVPNIKTRVHTDIQITLRETLVAIGRIYTLHAGDAA